MCVEAHADDDSNKQVRGVLPGAQLDTQRSIARRGHLACIELDTVTRRVSSMPEFPRAGQCVVAASS